MFEEKPYTYTISLETEMEKVGSYLIENNYRLRTEMDDAQNFFKREVIEEIKKRNYDVNEEEENKLTIKGDRSIDRQEIKDVVDQAIERVKSHIPQSFESTKNVSLRAQKESTRSSHRHGVIFDKPVNPSTDRAQEESTRSSHRHAGIFNESINTHTEGSSSLFSREKKSNDYTAASSKDEKQVHKLTLSLLEGYQKIKGDFQDYSQEYGNRIIRATQNLFKRKVVKRIEELGHKCSSDLTITSEKPIDVEEIRYNITNVFSEATMRSQMIIKHCKNHYQGAEQERMMVQLLRNDLQKKDIDSNSVSGNTLENRTLICIKQDLI